MTEWSLRQRLTRRLAVLITGFWIVASAIAAFVVYEEMSEVLDSSLEETAHRIAPLARSLHALKATDNDITIQNFEDTYQHEEYVSYQIRDTKGRMLFRSHDAPETGWALHPSDGFSNHGSWRIYSVHLKDKRLIIQVGENLNHRFIAVSETTLAMVSPILVLLPVLLYLIHHVLNRVLVPITAFSHEIEDRGSGNLSDVEAGGLPNEFDTIRNKLNALLARLRSALDAERSFSANSAHQLRTPVAAALAQSEMLERELNVEADRTRVRKLSDALRRLGRVVEKLLQLARADLDTKSNEETVDPAGLLRLILSDYTTPLAGRKVIISGSEYAQPFTMDADSLGIIFQNIIENAITYSTPEAPIEFEFDNRGRLIVRNDCEVLSPDLLHQLGERFVRGSTDARGSGLGLAIVKSLARKSGIIMTIRSPLQLSERGFAIELQFPSQPQ